ncbi:MAG: MFS transporter [Planctomycetia bacterium]|nr:MFS transporter [Planctomycetia bacterium]
MTETLHESSDAASGAENSLPGNKPSEDSLLLRLTGAPLVPFSTLSAVGLPSGTVWAGWFALFNALSWPIMLGSPLFLYAKSLGAGDLTLGVLAAIPPLLIVLHIPGAHLIPRLGYRRVLIWGWGSRTVMIFVLALTAAIPTSNTWRLAGVFLCLTMFSAMRGLSGGAWMPWVTALIPPDVRGKFFLRDQLYGQSGNLLAILAATTFLLGNPQPRQFSLPFIFAAAGGTISVLCLMRVPDISAPDHHRQAGEKVELLSMLEQKMFRQLCTFNILYMLIMGGLTVFTVAFLRGVIGLSESLIVLVSGMSVLGGVLSLFWCGVVIDRIGSKPIMSLSLAALVMVFIGWWAVAGKILPASAVIVSGLYLLMGVAGMNFAAANNRLQSLNIPKIGRNHYFAVFLAVVNIAAGASPLLWGLVLESIGRHHAATGSLQWNRYSIYFACGAILAFLLIWVCQRLDES